MNYLLLRDDDSIQYPYSIQNLREDYPNTCFPSDPDEKLLSRYGVFEVFISDNVPAYDPETQELVYEKTPVKENSKWILHHKVQEKPEKKKDISAIAATVRSMRNRMLQQTDWMFVEDSPLSEEEKKKWKQYRKELRDISKQYNFPLDIEWPNRPS